MKLSKIKIVFLVLAGIVSLILIWLYINRYLYRTKASAAITEKGVMWAPNPIPGNIEADTQDMQRAGITWARISVTASMQPEFLDKIITTAKSHNIKILPIIWGIPDRSLGTATDRQNFKNWLSGLVNKYKNDMQIWEIHNEENLPFWSTPAPSDPGYNNAIREYVLHLQDAYTTIKGIDPSLKVMIGGLSTWTIDPFMERLKIERASQWFDIMAYHPYGSNPQEVISEMNKIRSILNSDSGFATKPIWITEMGFGNPDINGAYPGIVANEQTKADYLVQTYNALKNWGISSPIFWYVFTEASDSNYFTNINGYSLVRKYPNGTSAYLPAYKAMQNLWPNLLPTPTLTLPTPTPTRVPTVFPTSTPTSTKAPNTATLSLNLLLHGIGNGGDSSNPLSGGNINPLRPQRNISVEIFNSSNQLILTKTVTVNFNNAGGNFPGTFDLGASFPTGVYTVKVKTDQFLKNLVPGIQTITQSQTTQLPLTSLITGDMNNDNRLNVLDYNILMDCFSDLTPARDCSDQGKKTTADITDDGSVNQFDYNLFLRELTTNVGE